MNDKVIHFLASVMLVLILSVFIHYVLAMIIALAIGFLKEFADKYIKGSFFDWSDIYADAFGVIIGMGVAAYIY